MKKECTDFLIEFIAESDAIERITDDRELLRRQIEEGKIKGHAGAMLLLEARASQKAAISEALILTVQGLITSEQHLKPGGDRLEERFIGRYRDVPVWIGGRQGCKVELIPTEMLNLARAIRQWQREYSRLNIEENIRRAARFHFQFEHIHPFADGNGRTGRALVWCLLRFAGIEPFIFTNADKRSTYYKCFEKPEDMETYFLRRAMLSTS
jgi:Fic family protein